MLLLCILVADLDNEGESDPGSEELEADIPDVDGSHDVYLKSSSCHDERADSLFFLKLLNSVCASECGVTYNTPHTHTTHTHHTHTHHTHTHHTHTHHTHTHHTHTVHTLEYRNVVLFGVTHHIVWHNHTFTNRKPQHFQWLENSSLP